MSEPDTHSIQIRVIEFPRRADNLPFSVSLSLSVSFRFSHQGIKGINIGSSLHTFVRDRNNRDTRTQFHWRDLPGNSTSCPKKAIWEKTFSRDADLLLPAPWELSFENTRRSMLPLSSLFVERISRLGAPQAEEKLSLYKKSDSNASPAKRQDNPLIRRL